MEQGYIYLIQAEGTNFYKIGFTQKQPEERLKQLNGKQSPYNNLLIHSIWVDNVRAAEQHFHQLSSAYHHHNEWFNFPDEIARKLMVLMTDYQQQYVTETTSDPVHYLQQINDLPDWIGGGIVFLVLLLGLAYCSKMSNPEYVDCINGGGGQACERIHDEKKRKQDVIRQDK